MEEIIKEYMIRIYSKDENTQIVLPQSFDMIDKLIYGIEWLVEETINDKYIVDKEWKESKKASQYNIDEQEKLALRIGIRTHAYVLTLCHIEDYFIKDYERLINLFNKFEIPVSFNKKDYRYLKESFSKVRKFRDKVSAHTAHNKPKNDSPETMIDSLYNFFPRPTEISLGNLRPRYGLKSSRKETEVPNISIFDYEQKIKPILDSWCKLFISKLIEMHNLYYSKNHFFENDVCKLEPLYPHITFPLLKENN